MTKAVSVPLGFSFILILAGALMSPAQTNSPADMAVTEAVLRQANTVVLRQKLVQARDAAAHGDLVVAAQLYEDAYAPRADRSVRAFPTNRRKPFQDLCP